MDGWIASLFAKVHNSLDGKNCYLSCLNQCFSTYFFHYTRSDMANFLLKSSI